MQRTCSLTGIVFCCFTSALIAYGQTDPTHDSDRDGVTDDRDVCNNTPPGKVVDFWGRPAADIDQDCDVDWDDLNFIRFSWTGPLAPCPEGSACDDGLACTENDICHNHGCIGTPKHDLCDDGNYCNGKEICDGVAGCTPAPSPVDCSHLDSDCVVGECSESQDMCYEKPIHDYEYCDYTPPFSACLGGECTPSVPMYTGVLATFWCYGDGVIPYSTIVGDFNFVTDGNGSLVVYGADVPMVGRIDGAFEYPSCFEVERTAMIAGCMRTHRMQGCFEWENPQPGEPVISATYSISHAPECGLCFYWKWNDFQLFGSLPPDDDSAEQTGTPRSNGTLEGEGGMQFLPTHQ